MTSGIWSHRRAPRAPVLAFASALAIQLAVAAPASARLVLTEILPGVNTTATAGDTVEIFNTGPGAEDLTGMVLTDLDAASVEADPNSEGTFAPIGLAVPPLQPGDFALVVFTLNTGTAGFEVTNYGLRIVAPLLVSGGMFDTAYDQCVLLDGAPSPTALDAIVWGDAGSAPSDPTDTRDDLSALTPPTFGYGITVSPDARWQGADAIASVADYNAAAIQITGFTTVNTHGQGSIRRASVQTNFTEGAPDGVASGAFAVVDRTDATLGNFSALVTTANGLREIRETGSISDRVANLRITNYPERRIAVTEDTNDFVEPPPGDIAAFRAVVDLMDAGLFEEAFEAADPLGYEVVEFLDSGTATTFHILEENVEPGDAGFRGLGIYVFDRGVGATDRLILQAPHPINDSLTLAQIGLAIPQLRPRVAMIPGTHRNNSTTVTPCDGTFEGGGSYRVSDVAHYDVNFFHPAHEELENSVPCTITIQFHGFCTCNYPSLTDDCVVSNGVGAPAVGMPARVLAARIDAQGFVANDGGGGDLTTAALYDEDTTSLGGTNNLQGRFTNGVAPADVCDTDATTASERFVHLEQDLDVREEPQHVIDAIGEMLGLTTLACPTATPTVTASPTRSPSPSPSASPTRSPSPSPSASPTRSPSPSPSASASPTRSPSPSPSASPTGSPTVSPTRSHSPSPSATASPTHSPSPSPSVSPTGSPTVTGSPSASPTVSPTASPTRSPSPSPSPSASPTRSPSASPTASPTPSPSPSVSPTPSPTLSPTTTVSPTTSPTSGPSPSASPSASPTPSSTATPAGSATPTPSPSPSPGVNAARDWEHYE